ncbi:hypothetical protein GWO43_16075 [candidate division KSB1 bacterium]|nr:hypothetical protein [candidate division KSB1 bacterium]NIV68751.1 hypothetical protein [Phycisphaerae bacterium]NIS25468.1 hypothetical protein [candidate division KSB1 bacterium]NIT72361.1 hypothetical protein [candidate division KSB1 bacterium]NIU26145.1 hypothetical protein [candidate division KSB1 bacterium]
MSKYAEDIGYIKKSIDSLSVNMKEHKEEVSTRLDKIENDVGELKMDSAFRRKLVKTAKYVAALVFAILTLKFGEIKGLLK